MATQTTRVAVIGDLHSGHIVGLTPPQFDVSHESKDYQKIDGMRREYWKYFAREVDAIKPIDILIVNGDCIEGKGKRSGGTELIEADTGKQCDMAETAIRYVGAKHIVMTYGTPYHTGDENDFENKIAKDLKADKIGSHDWLDVNGCIIDYKHHCGSSVVPHGRHTYVARERLWNLLWAEFEECPKSHIILRSHVHYFDYCGGFNWLGMTLPALQGYGSKYGARVCSGTVDFGFVHFDITNKDNYTWTPHILKLKKFVHPYAIPSSKQK
jgi:hypothetical protein